MLLDGRFLHFPAPWGREMDNAFSGVILQPKVVPIYVRTLVPFSLRTSTGWSVRHAQPLRHHPIRQ